MALDAELMQGLGLFLTGLAAACALLAAGRRWRRSRARRWAREIAARLREPATSLADVEAQAAAIEELIGLSEAAAAAAAARELLGSRDPAVRSAAIEVLRRTRALEGWIRDLHQGGYRARVRAIEALGEVGDERAVEELIAALGDDDPDVAGAASQAVVARDPDYAADRLAEALSSPRRRVAETAAATLVRMGEEATEALVGQLLSPSAQARRLAVEALGAIGGRGVCDLLAPLLDTEPEPLVRLAAAEALARLGDRACLARIKRLAESDPEWFVRARAYALLAESNAPGTEEFLRRSLVELGPELAGCNGQDGGVEAVLEGTERVRSAIVTGLRQLGISEEEIAQTRAAAEAAAPAPAGASDQADDRPESASASGDWGERGVELLRQLGDRDPVRRAEAARELAELGLWGEPALRRALRDPAPLVRAEAARSLARIGAGDCLEALAQLLRDPDPEVRLAVSNAMRAIVMQHVSQPLQEGPPL